MHYTKDVMDKASQTYVASRQLLIEHVIEDWLEQHDLLDAATGRDSFGSCTPQQYHARLDMLWAAIPENTATGGDDVFTLVVDRIESLTNAAAAVVEACDESRRTKLDLGIEFDALLETLRIAAGLQSPKVE